MIAYGREVRALLDPIWQREMTRSERSAEPMDSDESTDVRRVGRYAVGGDDHKRDVA